jgi:hypothetical protein
MLRQLTRRSPAAPLLAVLLAAVAATVARPAAQSAHPAWPAAERDHKPWTRWWWPGSAVDAPNLTRQLEQIAGANLGGVEITPIYGARGAEARYREFLSPGWLAMLEHTAREARRLGLGVDMATGTGWPFGGPAVRPEDSSARIVLRDGRLAGEPTKMLVKRAAPGGAGLVLDPYSPDALGRYLDRFTRALAGLPRGLIRAQFHDSFEYYDAGWTPALPETFQRIHGYDLQAFAAALLGKAPADPDTVARVKSDYRETLAHLHLQYLDAWTNWAHAQGFVTRNQSHGAPANLLDLYGRVDVPETELFGSTPFPIPGLRRHDSEVRHDQDLPESLVIRMASSAAHVMGRRLASSESSTWLRDHWKVALSYAKPELDRVLLDGINHVFYHGTVYSPEDAAWPGWLFYASTQYNPNNTWWDDFGAMNRYIERVQSVLQHGAPDNEILVYWPVFDVWDRPDGMMQQLGVHDVKWLTEQPVGRLARTLLAHGYSFDYISDAQLERTRVTEGDLQTPGAPYKVLVVPAARRMPAATLEQIARLAEAGATVVVEALPEDVPGYGRLEERRARFEAALGRLSTPPGAVAAAARAGRSRVVRGDVIAALGSLPVAREPIVATGAGFTRREHPGGHDYFFANLSSRAVDQWVALGVPAASAVLLDPLTGSGGTAALRQRDGRAEVYLQLAPGASLILRASAREAASGPRWVYAAPAGTPIDVAGMWQVEFVKGGPVLPPPATPTALGSWTDFGGEAERFAGTARYRIEFDLASLAGRAVETDPVGWALDLGDVRESARVRLNGELVTTAWSIPFVVRLGDRLRSGRNVLELEVTNLAANRIRDMDRRGVAWKVMHEINFVNVNYRPFDASGWDLTPSGLLGPVRLVPLRSVQP